jgi:proteasome accessory factor C
MSDAAAQLKRLLALVPHLADGREHAVADVAARLNMDGDDVVRDLHALSERFGDPPGWIEKVQVFVRADHVAIEVASHFKRPMRITTREAMALGLGLSILRAEGGDESAIERARQRLSALTSGTEPVADDRAASIGPARDAKHVAALRDALRNRRRVVIHYQKGSSARVEKRPVCPFSFAVERGTWYLVAHCDKSDAIRIFRLDRIHGIELTKESFDRPAELAVESLLKDRAAFVGQAAATMRVRYSARIAGWIKERAQGVEAADGSFVVEYPLADEEWAVRQVLQYGPEAEVLSPGSVRRELVKRLTSVLNLRRTLPGPG